jgi:membrane fusion protein (multidrug efflux system)
MTAHRKEWFWRTFVVLMLVALGWLAWVAYQVWPRPLATDLAYKAKSEAKARPPTAAAAPPPTAAPTVAVRAEPVLALAVGSALAQSPPKPAQDTLNPGQGAPIPGGTAAKPAAAESVKAAANQPEVAALIVAGEETTMSSQMAGRIRQLRVGLGDRVKKGARLMEFDCSEQRAQYDTADAEYRAARETHLARLRLQALGAAGELEVTVAAAAADKARSQVTLRRSQLAYCSVSAPFAGNVARLRVKPSESVNVGQPLVDLVNPGSLKAQMFVPASWIVWLRPGLPLSINIRDTGQTFNARVSKINSRVDGVSQQLEIEARIDKGQDRLLPGMVGSASFPQQQPRK